MSNNKFWVQTHFRLRHDGTTCRKYFTVMSCASSAQLSLIKSGDHEIRDGVIFFGERMTRQALCRMFIRLVRDEREPK